MNKNCFLITSYCNTDKKISTLLDCITTIRDFGFGDICLHAHYPLGNDVQSKVKHYIYDSSNPVLKYPEKSLYFWRLNLDAKIKMSLDKNDYGYTVLQQWKRGFNYLKRLGYENIIMINYDVIITKRLAKGIIRRLTDRKDKFKGVLFYFKENINMALAAFNSTNILLDSLNISDYKLYNGFAENYLENKIKQSNISFSVFEPPEYESYFYTTMDVEGDKTYKASGVPNEEISSSPFDKFTVKSDKFFGAQFHLGVMGDKFYLFVFRIEEPHDIEIGVKGMDIKKFSSYNNKHLLYELPIKYEDFLSDKYEIILKIDGQEISQDTIKLFKEHSILEYVK